MDILGLYDLVLLFFVGLLFVLAYIIMEEYTDDNRN